MKTTLRIDISKISIYDSSKIFLELILHENDEKINCLNERRLGTNITFSQQGLFHPCQTSPSLPIVSNNKSCHFVL